MVIDWQRDAPSSFTDWHLLLDVSGVLVPRNLHISETRPGCPDHGIPPSILIKLYPDFEEDDKVKELVLHSLHSFGHRSRNYDITQVMSSLSLSLKITSSKEEPREKEETDSQSDTTFSNSITKFASRTNVWYVVPPCVAIKRWGGGSPGKTYILCPHPSHATLNVTWYSEEYTFHSVSVFDDWLNKWGSVDKGRIDGMFIYWWPKFKKKFEFPLITTTIIIICGD